MSARIARIVGATGVVTFLTASPVCADWSIGVFAGAAHTAATSLTLIRPGESTNVALAPVHYRSESFAPPIYYGYRIGFFPRSSWIGIEGELIHLKVVADTSRTARMDGVMRGETVSGTVPISSLVEHFSITHGVNLLLVNAVMRRPLGAESAERARWTVSARLGAGGSIPHPESDIGGRSFEGYEWGALSLQAAAGAEMRVAARLSIVGEYKLTRTVQEVTISGGTARTPLTTHHVAGGLALRLR
jgi:hypothetical protein